jgi:hypothetical protein
MTPQEFGEIVNKESDFDYGLCPPPITAERGLDILIDHFLGKDWYVIMSMSKEQVYTEAIYEILEKTQKRQSFFKRLFGR